MIKPIEFAEVRSMELPGAKVPEVSKWGISYYLRHYDVALLRVCG